MEECDQKVWNIFDQFDITIYFSATYFLEVGAGVFTEFLGCFSEAKMEEWGQKRDKETIKI